METNHTKAVTQDDNGQKIDQALQIKSYLIVGDVWLKTVSDTCSIILCFMINLTTQA